MSASNWSEAVDEILDSLGCPRKNPAVVRAKQALNAAVKEHVIEIPATPPGVDRVCAELVFEAQRKAVDGEDKKNG